MTGAYMGMVMVERYYLAFDSVRKNGMVPAPNFAVKTSFIRGSVYTLVHTVAGSLRVSDNLVLSRNKNGLIVTHI